MTTETEPTSENNEYARITYVRYEKGVKVANVTEYIEQGEFRKKEVDAAKIRAKIEAMREELAALEASDTSPKYEQVDE